jgi:signal transduction histidine kinase
MHLADFLLAETDAIVAEWEVFARGLPAGARLSRLDLRDHAQQILEAIAADLRTAQTREEQAAKSKGLAPVVLDAGETAAQTHAILRARAGFDIKQLVSEYRALRASVLRLAFDAWAPAEVPLDEVMRFNEAIDQALAESVCFYAAQVDRSRNLLLGMLGHDMRSPLQAIQMTAECLAALNAGADVSSAAARLVRSGARMQTLLDQLVDYNRTQLGVGLNVDRRPGNLAEHCANEVEELRAAHPSVEIEFSVEGDCRGDWDEGRVEQMLANLVVNAVRYGKRDAPIRVAVRGGPHEVCIDVANQGVPSRSEDLTSLFAPLKRGANVDSGKGSGSLGLGLFIAREVARAHGGTIDVRCDDAFTVFTVCLPRQAGAASTVR